MFGLHIRKRIDTDKVANIFVNSMIEVVENGFHDVVEMIQDDAAFIAQPQIEDTQWNHFLLIVVVGNLEFLKESFEEYQPEEIEASVIEKFAAIFEVKPSEFKKLIKQTLEYIKQHNYPSKNTLYGMSKAVFYKYNLNQYQESYFKSMLTPNPLFLKRLDEIMINFVWDWDTFLAKFKIVD